jgi:Tol biopolymer transport system component
MRAAGLRRGALLVAALAASLACAPARAAKSPAIAFMTRGDGANGTDIWSVGPGDHRLHQLTDFATSEDGPDWSPHHHNIVFARHLRRKDSPDTGIYRMRANGSGVRPIFQVDPFKGDDTFAPAWSHDGHWIAFALRRYPFGFAIATISPNGKHFKRITPFGSAFDPSWSPDGKHIVYEDVNLGIVRIRADGSHPRVLAKTGYDPDWSPDGKLIAYWDEHLSNGPPGPGEYGTDEVITIHPDGTHRRDITRHRDQLLCSDDNECQRHDQSPEWSPSGKRIVYAEDAPALAGRLVIARRDGSHERRLRGFHRSDPGW